jgi:SSS family solute:Na+ symporter
MGGRALSELGMFDFSIIGCYLVAVLALGVWAGRRIGSFEEYAVAGRSYSSFVVFATLSASFIGGGFTMGNAEKVFTFGIVNVVALWGFSLKEILVAKFVAPRVGAFPDAISPGDVMERDYGRAGKVVTGVFAVFLCAGILGAQIGAMGYMFNLFLGLPVWEGVLIGMGIIIIYDTVGGMRAIVATDVLQFLILAIGIPLCLYMGIRTVGGVDAVVEAVPSSHFQLFGSVSPVKFVSLFMTFLLGETLVPPYVRRLFISRDTAKIARGTFWSGVFSVPFFAVSGGIGLVAMTMDRRLDPNFSLPYVVQAALPIGIRGFVIAGVLAVVMSSADSFLNSASISFINDIINPLRRTPLDDRVGLRWARTATLLTGTFAIIFALKIRSILDILIYAYNFWSPIILVPLAAALLGLRAPRAAFIAGAVAGIAGVVVWNRLLGAPGGFEGLVVGVISNLIAFTLAFILFPTGPRRELRAGS